MWTRVEKYKTAKQMKVFQNNVITTFAANRTGGCIWGLSLSHLKNDSSAGEIFWPGANNICSIRFGLCLAASLRVQKVVCFALSTAVQSSIAKRFVAEQGAVG